MAFPKVFAHPVFGNQLPDALDFGLDLVPFPRFEAGY